jgi:hypothetical protein
MDERRFEELDRKRTESGLTEEEANELGRLMAERMGQPYSNAQDREDPDALDEKEGLPDPTNVTPDVMPDEEMREAIEEDVGEQPHRERQAKSA